MHRNRRISARIYNELLQWDGIALISLMPCVAEAHEQWHANDWRWWMNTCTRISLHLDHLLSLLLWLSSSSPHSLRQFYPLHPLLPELTITFRKHCYWWEMTNPHCALQVFGHLCRLLDCWIVLIDFLQVQASSHKRILFVHGIKIWQTLSLKVRPSSSTQIVLELYCIFV